MRARRLTSLHPRDEHFRPEAHSRRNVLSSKLGSSLLPNYRGSILSRLSPSFRTRHYADGMHGRR